MREDRPPRRAIKPRVDPGVHFGDHVGDGADAFTDEFQYLPLALFAVAREATDELLWLGDGVAVCGLIDLVSARHELFEAAHVIGHVAVGGRNHSR